MCKVLINFSEHLAHTLCTHVYHIRAQIHKQLHFVTIQRSPAEEGGGPPPAARVTYWLRRKLIHTQTATHAYGGSMWSI